MLLSCYNPIFNFIDLDTGIKMRYVRLGTPGGHPFILIHGASDSYYSYSQVGPYLAQEGYDVFIPELRGHGGSDKPYEGDYSIETHAKDIREFISKLNIPEFHLVGHSLGSFIAQELAVTYPELMKSMTLIGSGCKLINNPTLDWLLNGDDSFPGVVNFDKEVPEEFIKDWTSTNNADRIFALHIYEHACSLPGFIWSKVFKSVSQADNTDRLNHIKIPVQIIWGTEDPFFNYEEQIQLIHLFEESTRICFLKKLGASHNTHWDMELARDIARDIISFS